MIKLLRTLVLGSLGCTALGASAQGHTLFVSGHLTPCTPSNVGNAVIIRVDAGPSGPVTMTTTLNENCFYSIELLVPETNGLVTVGTSCGNGIFQQDSAMYSIIPPATAEVVIDLSCGVLPSCHACFSIAQTTPFTAGFTSCSVGAAPITYLWDFSGPGGGTQTGDGISHTFPGAGQYAVCLIMTDANGCTSNQCQTVFVDPNGGISTDPPTSCAACITIQQASNTNGPIPFALEFVNCSSGTGPFSYVWRLPDGSMSGNQHQNWTCTSPGVYGVCLTIYDQLGCSSFICDSVFVDANGIITTIPVLYDCLNIANGPNVPGTPCTNPTTGVTGIWDAQCNCVPNVIEQCQADFWVMQAYENGDTTGTGTPIANTLWVWNLSSGGTGMYQFVWDFGDGTTSTDPFPTHTYAGSGPYLLCLTLVDSENCTSIHCDSLYVDDNGLYNGLIGEGGSRSTLTVNVVNPLSLGVSEHRTIDALSLWPNPVREQLNVAFTSSTGGTAQIEVVDLNGRTVRTQQEAMMLGGNRIQLATEALPAGLYAVRVITGSSILTQRFVRN